MSLNPPRPLPDREDPHVAAAIARAERRRGGLERLSEIGMALAEQVGAHAAAKIAAVNEDRAGDPARAFATVSRAVRMTFALEARFDDHILALRRGLIPAPRNTRSAAAVAADTSAEPEATLPVARQPDPRRDRANTVVREVIHLEVETLTRARETLDALNERLFDREAYDVLLDLPLRDAVAAICADLGLDPDWDLWTDDVGFVAPPGRRCIDWTTLVIQRDHPSRSKAPSPRRPAGVSEARTSLLRSGRAFT